MSLLNEMLRDIEKGKEQKARVNVSIPTLKPVLWSRQAQSYIRFIILAVILANLIIIAAISISKNRHAKALPTPVAVTKDKITSSKPLYRVVHQSVLPSLGELKPKQAINIAVNVSEKPKSQVKPIKKESTLSLREKSLRRYRQAMRFLKNGEKLEAYEILKSVTREYPTMRQAWQTRVLLEMELGRLTTASVSVDRALQLYPGTLTLIQYKATVLLNQGKLDSAVNLLLLHRPTLKEQPDYFALLAAIYEKRGNPVKAGQIYQALVQVAPGNPKYWLGYALSLEHTNHNNQALSAYAKVLENYSDDPLVVSYARERIGDLRG